MNSYQLAQNEMMIESIFIAKANKLPQPNLETLFAYCLSLIKNTKSSHITQAYLHWFRTYIHDSFELFLNIYHSEKY